MVSDTISNRNLEKKIKVFSTNLMIPAIEVWQTKTNKVKWKKIPLDERVRSQYFLVGHLVNILFIWLGFCHACNFYIYNLLRDIRKNLIRDMLLENIIPKLWSIFACRCQENWGM